MDLVKLSVCNKQFQIHGSEVSVADYQKQDTAVEILTAAWLRRMKAVDTLYFERWR